MRKGLIVATIGFLALATTACRPSDPVAEVTALARDGDPAAALQRARELLDENPNQSELQLLYGDLLVGAGESVLAVWPLRKAASDPEFAIPAGLALAKVLLATGNADDSIVAATEVLRLDSENETALAIRAKAYVQAQREVEALEDLDRLLEKDPDRLDTLVTRLTALLELERATEAAGVFDDIRARLDAAPDAYEPEFRGRMCVVEARFTLESGDQEGSKSLIEACLKQFPVDPLVLRGAVEYYLGAGRPERAREILEAAHRLVPEDPNIRSALIQRLEKDGFVAEAESMLVEAAGGGTGSANSSLALYDFYWRHGRFEEARSALEEAMSGIEDVPTTISLAYADALIEVGELDRALDLGRDLEPGYRELVTGRVLLAKGDAEAALESFESGIRAWPDNATVRWLAGQAADRLGRLDQAAQHYLETVRIEETEKRLDRTDAAWRVARFQEAMGFFDAALNFVQIHILHDRFDPEGYKMAARLGNRLGSQEVVRGALLTLAKLEGQSAVALAMQAGFIREQAGPRAAIDAIVDSGLDLNDPANIAALDAVIEFELESGHRERASRRAREALDHARESAEFHALYAELLERTGMRGVAEKEFSKAIEIDPDNIRALRGQARLASAQGRIDEAIRLFDRISALEPASFGAAYEAAKLLLRDPERATEAERRLSALLEKDPLNVDAARDLAALLFFRDGPSPIALAAATRAALFGDARALELKGRIELAHGDGRSAVDTLKKAIAAGGQGGSTYYQLANALLSIGRDSEAVSALGSAIESGGFEEVDEARKLISRIEERLEIVQSGTGS